MVNGQFIYYKTEKGYYNYRLKANNNITLIVSGGTGYSSLQALKLGIESLKKNLDAPIEDQTLKKYEKLKYPKFEIYEDKAGEYRFRLSASNGELLCVCEDGYASKESCKNGIESVARWAKSAEIVSGEK